MSTCYEFLSLLCHWLPCGILLKRKFLTRPQEAEHYFHRKPAEVSMCAVASTAIDCCGSFRGGKSFQILGSQDLNSSAASLVIAVGSSGKADTAVWHLMICLPIVSPEEWRRGSRGKKRSHHHSPPAPSLSALLCLLYPLRHFSRPTRPPLIQKTALQMQILQVKAHCRH